MSIYQKRSTSIYVILILYVCTFCFFLNIGIHSVENSDFYVNNSIDRGGIFTIFIQDQDQEDMFVYILKNNVKSLFLNYIGLVTFGFYPILSTFKNGGVFGFVFGTSIKTNGVQFSIAHTLPHSFELIPFILSAADGMFLGINIGLNLILSNKKKIEWIVFLKRLCLYLILIVFAAFCEVFISMKL